MTLSLLTSRPGSFKAMSSMAAIGAFLVIFAGKLLLIGHYASPVPHFDEWDGDGANLLVPFLDGRLTLHDLLAPHNEHRILLTRLLVLTIVELGGRWDVIAQMEINAALHAASLVLIGLMLADAASDGRDPASALTILAFTVAASVVPFGLGNTLQAFQTQFYLFIALSFGCIAVLVPATAFSGRWWGGVLVGVLSLFSIASGALALCAPLGVAVLQTLRGQQRGTSEVAGMIVWRS